MRVSFWSGYVSSSRVQEFLTMAQSMHPECLTVRALSPECLHPENNPDGLACPRLTALFECLPQSKRPDMRPYMVAAGKCAPRRQLQALLRAARGAGAQLCAAPVELAGRQSHGQRGPAWGGRHVALWEAVIRV